MCIRDRVGAFQDTDALLPGEESILVTFLQSKNKSYWNRSNIILLAILVEHLVIALKIVIAMIIPDVPRSVKDNEERRKLVIEQAESEI